MTSLDTQTLPGAVRNRTITWNDPAPSRERGRALNGYERLTAIQRGDPALRSGGRVTATDARVLDDDDTLYAHATSTCLILRGPR